MYKFNLKIIPLILGVYFGVGLFFSIDVWIRVSQIDMNDPATLPNMHPIISLFMIPVVGTIIMAVVSIVEIIRGFIWKTKMTLFFHWIILGMSYTTLFTFMPLGRVMPIFYSKIITVILIIIFNPVTVHIIFKIKGDDTADASEVNE